LAAKFALGEGYGFDAYAGSELVGYDGDPPGSEYSCGTDCIAELPADGGDKTGGDCIGFDWRVGDCAGAYGTGGYCAGCGCAGESISRNVSEPGPVAGGV
jgi:hypothetical protein